MPAYFYSSVAGQYTLTSSITSSATTVSLNSVAGLPTAPFKIVIDPGLVTEEICKVTGVAGTSLTVVRGWDSTIGVAHSVGVIARHMMTAEDLTLSRQHEDATIAHGATGAVVGTTNSQTLTNKDLSSGTNAFPTNLATLTGSQVLSNKDLTAGTNVFPTSLVTLTGTQTLTNKTLTAPLGTNAVLSCSTSSSTALTLKAATSQSVDIGKITDSTGAAIYGRWGAFDFNAGSCRIVYDQTMGLFGASEQATIKSVASTPTVRPLLLKGAASQSANLAEWRNSADAVLGSIDPAGNVSAPNLNWTSFVPTLTNASASTIEGKKRTLASGRVEFEVFIVLSAAPTGNVSVSLPATAVTPTTGLRAIATGVAKDVSAGSYIPVTGIVQDFTTYTSVSLMTPASGSNTFLAFLSAAVPVAWASGDTISLKGSFDS